MTLAVFSDVGKVPWVKLLLMTISRGFAMPNFMCFRSWLFIVSCPEDFFGLMAVMVAKMS